MNTDNNTIGRVRTLISIGKHLGSHAGTEEQPRALPENQLRELNSRMNASAKNLRWSSSLKNAQNLPHILAQALACASTELQSTSLRDRVIAPTSVPNGPALEAELNSEQKAELKRALKQKDWEALITHSILQVDSSSSSPSARPRRRQRVLNPEVQQQAISKAWNGQYFGDNHRLLLNNINHMLRGRPYSNSVTILQSSGTGKSRMVHEQSDLVFTLPFNLRPHTDDKDIAYPLPDTDVGTYLDWTAPNLREGQTRYLHFLGNLFRTVSDELARLYKAKQPTYAALASSWRNHLDEGQNRTRIYKEAVDGCRTDVPRILRSSLDPSSVDGASEEAKKQLVRLLNRIDECCKSLEGFQNGQVKLMLYFDEAHVLAEKKVIKDPNGKNMYDVMCSCFNFFLSSSIFVIYLSTNSNISDLPPMGPLARSGRARKNADALQAPVTETPFDCFPKFVVKSDDLRLEDVCEVEFMARFGRPMFWTLIAGAGNNKDEILSTIVDLARAKLICSHNIFDTHTALGPVAAAAVLDVLLTLDFEPRRQAAYDREAKLVAGHMRIAFSVPKDREYLRSGYPSEPLLAEAAARQMDEFQMLAGNPDTSVMAHILKFEFSSGLVHQGQRGEIVFRQLVSEAYRRAVRKDYPNELQHNFSRGCKLITFIKTLFSDDCAEQVLNSVPDNIKSSTTFATAFADAIVRFTHFGKMTDDTATTTHAMFAAFVRCMAVIFWSSQKSVDLLIPVLLAPGEKLRESVMTGLLIQVKRRRAKGSVIQYAIDQDALGFFPAPIKIMRPYITLVVELGVQLPISPAAITQPKVREKLAKSDPNPQMTALQTPRKPPVVEMSITPSKLRISEQPELITHSRDVHPRYSIFAYGCSDTVYGVIGHSDRPIYKFLLANRDMLDEHPRKDENSLRAVRTMKPFWSAGIECYHWIDSAFLRKYQVLEDDDDGGLAVGKYDGGDDDLIGGAEQSSSLQR